MHELISLWMSWVQDWGYAGVIVLMAMESSIFPVPSEVVIPPAAILSAQEGASMNFWGVVAAGTFGSWLGSAITYAVARIVGRPVIMRWGKFFFMPPHKVEKAEIFLQRYEVSGVFFARLLPVIRHLISIPAGIVRMGFGIFSLVTVLGSFAWCTVLAWYGHRIGERHPELLKSPEELIRTVKSESLPLILAVLVLAVCYILMLRLTDRNKPEKAAADTLAGLKSAEGFIRRQLAHTVNLRNTPEIRFILDQSIEYGVTMTKLIDDVVKTEQRNEDEDRADSES